MVFQDPMTSLNPAFTIGTQLVDTIRLHRDDEEAARRGHARVELLELVGIPDPERRLKDYPHQLSGGMRQRALLALALSCEPRLLIADEPTTALDVTVQAQILDLLRSLQERLGMAVIFVTHDLGVVADLCSRVIVMYAGQVVEEASVEELFARPATPVHRGAARRDPAGRRGRRAAGVDPRRGARSADRDADRLPVPPALPVRGRRECTTHAGRARALPATATPRRVASVVDRQRST